MAFVFRSECATFIIFMLKDSCYQVVGNTNVKNVSAKV